MRKLYGVIFMLLCISVNAQNNVGIGILTPDQSAVLHLQSDNKGLLIPRLTTAERTAISSPASGLLVYDTDATCFFFFRNNTWESLCAANASAIGITGYTGATGTTGAAGLIGITGVQGWSGVTGATGDNGTNGEIGVTGATGQNGIDGIIGVTGATGNNGTNGEIGVTGATGQNGIDGEIGMTGATGNNGNNGAIGVTGATGNNGSNGEIGITGATGSNGTNGVIGTTGATGNNGTNGVIGVTGATGNNGAVGITGATGNNGTNGTTGATGNNGMIGVTGVTGNNGTNGIIGVTGTTGNNGTNGIIGVTGATGNNGTNGTIGVTGATGNNGTNGIIGVTGATGNNGTNGVTGATGNNGTNGAIGVTGATGNNGNNGTIGVTGATGNNGTNGVIGVTGATGNNGTNGVIGVTGATGNNGTNGIIGATGNNGTNGVIGTTGSTGNNGTNGVTGTTGFTGNIGVTGSTGQIGITSNTGTTGHTGNAGATGDIGYTGTTGHTGNAGATGDVGYTGVTGHTGNAGATGDVGYTGAIGHTGNVGATGDIGYTGTTGHTGSAGGTGDVGYTGTTGHTGNVGTTGDVGYTGATGHTGNVGATGYTSTTGSTGATGNKGDIGVTGHTGQVGATGPVGCATANYVLKSTASSADCSIIYDNGTAVGISTNNPAQGKLWVQGGDIWTTGDGTKLAFSTDGSTDATPNASVTALQNGISGASADLIFKTWNGAADAEIMRVRSNGNVGIGTATPQSMLHIMGKVNIHQSGAGGGQNRFEGLETVTSANGRAQLVLSSAYSDLIIASSQANDNHGSTLTFATYNPSNAGDYRKWIVNQGNWGLRSQFMDFGYATNITNPHSAIGSGTTTFTLDGTGRKAGIRMINPLVPLEVGHNGAESYGIGSLINQYAVGNSDGPKLGFRKLNNTGPANKDWAIGIANGVDVTRFGISEDGGVGGFGTERLTILAGGNVGVGNTAPGYPMHVKGTSGDGVPTLMVESTASATTWNSPMQVMMPNIGVGGKNMFAIGKAYASGKNGYMYYYHAGDGNAGNSLRFGFYGIDDIFNITAAGRIGIGTNNPTRAKLEIVGSGPNITSNYWWLALGSATGPCNSCTAPYSIYADGRIASSEFNAFSDERIKNIKGVSDAANDLQTISRIEITDYTLKDTIAKGTKPYKKVIAQQVEKVYPQAITISTDIVPNIYRVAEIHNGWINLKTNLKAGDRVKLIFENREEIMDVKDISAEGFNVSAVDSGKVFVYGTEVSDFRSVDYEAISMLNVSATQELAKQLAELKRQTKSIVNQDQRLEEQQKQIDRLVEENKQLVEQLNELKRLFRK